MFDVINRKRSWEASEKAIAKGKFKMQIDALARAISGLQRLNDIEGE
jgi:hypothetical protein